VAEFSVFAAVAIAAAVAMGVAGWRSHAIPRWCSIAYPIGFVLNMTDAPVVAWIGLALLVVTGTVIARGSKPSQGHADAQEPLTKGEPK
jgi:multisubunit Na+/H+ antiporter MnhB subunit